MSHFKFFWGLTSEILGVDADASNSKIQYGYYRMMTLYHPDKNENNLQANRKATLINEAKDFLMDKETNPNLLNDQELIADLMTNFSTVVSPHTHKYLSN